MKISTYSLILLCFFQSTRAILNPIDFLALQSIRRSLHDVPGSNFFSSWDFTDDPCNFAGVFCVSDKVVALNLGESRAGSPGLTGKIDTAIGKLSSLVDLTVSPGRVYGPLPPSISKLNNLKFLGISRNFIFGEIPAGLGQLRNLRTIDLSYNQLAGAIPPSIGKLPNLNNLMLRHNRLTGSIPSFASAKNLNRLDLKHNSLTGSLAPDSLPSSLQYLSLSWNKLTGTVDRVLYKLNRLNYLDLSFNRFTGSIPRQLFSFPLTNLQLERNQLYGPVEPFNEVTIQTVDLSFNKLSGEISPLLASVQNLYLNNNGFTGEVPGSFVERLLAANIQILYLQHNYLTGIVINPTAEIPLSSSLCLQYNCMVPPIQMTCPSKAGYLKIRPANQCNHYQYH